MPDADQQDIEKAIRAIQDIALILTGASEYVCEGRMLKRYSSDIEKNLENLETYISRLKEKFPGKFPESLKPDSSLSKIKEIAASMKGDDAKIEVKCRAGELGDEVFLELKELKAVVGDIRDTLGGKVVSTYGFADRIKDQRGRFTSLFSGLSSFISTIGKIILAVVIVLMLSFVYLYVTMESEDTLVASINNVLTSLPTQKDTLSKQKKDHEEIIRNINALENKKLTRDEKIQLLNLSTESKKLKERIDKGTLSIEENEKEAMEKKKRLEELRKKTFLQKLFKR
jgi:hypothetical protein